MRDDPEEERFASAQVVVLSGLAEGDAARLVEARAEAARGRATIVIGSDTARLTAFAEELADSGSRLAIVHGDPTDPQTVIELDELRTELFETRKTG